MKDDDKMILDDIIELQSIAQAGLYYGKDVEKQQGLQCEWKLSF